MATEVPKRSAAPQAAVALAVGALIGFGAGYFAGGGGRRPVPAREAPAGDRAAALERELERDPENPELLTELGNLRYDRQEWDQAIALYEKARRKAPRNPALLSDLGAAHRNRGEFGLAVSYFQKARAAAPDHWQAFLNEVLVEAFDRRDAAAAQKAFDELKRRFPQIPQLDRIQAQISGLVFVLFMLLTVLRGLRIFFQAVFRRPRSGPSPRGGGVREAEMIRDPVCGTWIDRGLALSARRGGEIVPVCSERCRNRLEAAG
jgi:tetratricopeptide (TPR) repeat protein